MNQFFELRFWMNENRENFKHSFYNEPVQFLGKTYHRCNWTFEDRISVTGHGFAPDLNLALTKAMVEAVERLVVMKLKILTTNGTAAHFESEPAKVNAIQELIERDAYLGHWYGGIAPKYVEKLNTELGEFSLYELHSSRPEIKVAMATVPYKEGFVIALGSHTTWKNASLKAMEELGTIKYGLMKSESGPMTIADLENRRFVLPIDHIRWGLSKEAGSLVKNWLESKPQIIDIQNSAPSVKEIKWPFPESPPPLKFMQASGPGYLNLFFGMPAKNLDQLSSLSRWSDRTILLPHTFG